MVFWLRAVSSLSLWFFYFLHFLTQHCWLPQSDKVRHMKKGITMKHENLGGDKKTREPNPFQPGTGTTCVCVCVCACVCVCVCVCLFLCLFSFGSHPAQFSALTPERVPTLVSQPRSQTLKRVQTSFHIHSKPFFHKNNPKPRFAELQARTLELDPNPETGCSLWTSNLHLDSKPWPHKLDPWS